MTYFSDPFAGSVVAHPEVIEMLDAMLEGATSYEEMLTRRVYDPQQSVWVKSVGEHFYYVRRAGGSGPGSWIVVSIIDLNPKYGYKGKENKFVHRISWGEHVWRAVVYEACFGVSDSIDWALTQNSKDRTCPVFTQLSLEGKGRFLGFLRKSERETKSVPTLFHVEKDWFLEKLVSPDFGFILRWLDMSGETAVMSKLFTASDEIGGISRMDVDRTVRTRKNEILPE